MVPAAHVEGLYSCLDYYQAVDDPFSRELLAQYDGALPGRRQVHRRQRLLGPLPRRCGSGPRRSPRPARSSRRDVIAALDHAEIAEGPGGPAAMVPGQHHLRLQMYIAQARDGRFEIVESLGAIDPQEREVEIRPSSPDQPTGNHTTTTDTKGAHCCSQPRRSRTSTASSSLHHRRRREAPGARLQGRARLPRPERDRPRLGHLRLGRRGLAELRLRSRGAADHEGGRPQVEAAAARVRRPLRRLSHRGRAGATQVGAGLKTASSTPTAPARAIPARVAGPPYSRTTATSASPPAASA